MKEKKFKICSSQSTVLLMTSLAYLVRVDRLMTDRVPVDGDLVATLLQLRSKSDDI